MVRGQSVAHASPACSISVASARSCQTVAGAALTWITAVTADPIRQTFDRRYQLSTANAVLQPDNDNNAQRCTVLFGGGGSGWCQDAGAHLWKHEPHWRLTENTSKSSFPAFFCFYKVFRGAAFGRLLLFHTPHMVTDAATAGLGPTPPQPDQGSLPHTTAMEAVVGGAPSTANPDCLCKPEGAACQRPRPEASLSTLLLRKTATFQDAGNSQHVI